MKIDKLNSKQELIYLFEMQLLDNETLVPENVKLVGEYLYENKVGFILSRNTKAEGCYDARSKRCRLGHQGIPLFDELKSFIGRIITTSSNDIIIAVHCRANVDISYDKVLNVLGIAGNMVKMEKDELHQLYSMNYGTVNPFLLEIKNKDNSIIQIFDNNILTPIAKVPGTMMTNAGDHTWGIEFDPSDIGNAIPKAIFADVAGKEKALSEHENINFINPLQIGIITGNGPDSGIALWQIIIQEFSDKLGRHFLGDISFPPVNILSVPEMGLSMELMLRETATWNALSKACNQLCNGGAKILGVACNTTQYFRDKIRQLCEQTGTTFVSMSDIVINHVLDNNISEFAIIGIDTVTKLSKWSAYSELSKLKPERLDKKTVNKIEDITYQVKQKGNLYQGFQRLMDIFRNNISSQHIIVALTEISIILNSQPIKQRERSKKNIIDTLELYGKSIAKASIGEPI